MREETETETESESTLKKKKKEDGDTGGTRAAAKCGASEVDHSVGAGESCMRAALLPPLPTTGGGGSPDASLKSCLACS